jgi:dGTP triphosphohydrolase
MKTYFAIILSLLLSISFSLVMGCKKVEKTAEAPKPAESPMVTAPVQAPEVKETDEHFQKAHEFFLKKDVKEAASEIRRGADLIKKEAEKATEEAKKGLTASADELEKLAKDIEKGVVTSEKKLKDTFARAEHALAKHHYLNASEQWAKKETKETGNALKKAAQHMEQAAKWAGHKLEASTVKIIEEVRFISGKLIKGTGWVADEVGKGIQKMGAVVTKLGEKIAPHKK